MPILLPEVPKHLKEQIIADAAELILSGVGVQKAAQILSEKHSCPVSKTMVERWQKHDTFLKIEEEFKKKIIRKAASNLQTGSSKLIPKTLEAIERALDKDNMNAVAHVIKLVGLGVSQPEQAQQTVINVVPATSLPKPERDITEIEPDES